MRRRNGDTRSRIRVLVGDDSSFMRRLISDALAAEPGIEIAGTAADGREVLRKAVAFRPDCITLDLEMPKMDGLETLRFLMSEWPTPIVVVSAHTAEGARLTLKCLEYGAIDFVMKTLGGRGFPADELVAKVRAAATVDPARIRFTAPEALLPEAPKRPPAGPLECVVAIGASTGGPQALMEIVPRLPAGLAAGYVIVQHMPPTFTRYLAERLDARSAIEIREAEEGDALLPGRALVAPGGMHLFYEEGGGKASVMLLAKNELQRSNCPSIDFTFASFAPIFGSRLIGVILTGMGRDGAAGCAAIRRHGGRVICQDRSTSLIYGMPGAVESDGLADETVSIDRMAERIVALVREIVPAPLGRGVIS